MYRNILAPLDGSSFGEHALPWAAGIAKRAGARLQLMHVHPPLEPAYTEFQLFDSDWESRVREQEKEYLEGMAVRVRQAASSIDVLTLHKDGYVANTIREEAVLAGADLIVLTTHARGALGRFWLGSVTDELIRTVPMPLLLIHPTHEKPDLMREHLIKSIVLPLDGTPLAEQMIAPAVALGRLFDAKFHLVKVIRPIMSSVVPVGLGTLTDVASHMAQEIDAAQTEVIEDARNYLSGIAVQLSAEGVKAEVHVEAEEQPGVGILNAARNHAADLIALATHGRRGLSRMFLGSVSDKVLRGATAPVLVHRPQGS